ncbi:MAG: hypothetical protein IIB82_16420 [Bacteroidetes bacterium]|nr:hypothetical protein [Bacteroidota bacterium]
MPDKLNELVISPFSAILSVFSKEIFMIFRSLSDCSGRGFPWIFGHIFHVVMRFFIAGLYNLFLF